MKACVPNTHKLLKLNNKKEITGEEWTKDLTKEDVLMANR
jgi:hypothetical protein